MLKTLSDGKLSQDVTYRAGALMLQRKKNATSVAILLEVPLHGLQATPPPGPMDVHCGLAALIKDSSGTLVQKISSDRALRITAEQYNLGKFLDKTIVDLAPGEYTLDSAVADMANMKMGAQHTAFTVPGGGTGVGISALIAIRSYTPGAKDLDPGDPFQIEGGSVTPTMDTTFKKLPNFAFRLFLTIYPDASISSKPSVKVEITKDGATMETDPMILPPADALGRIPYLMTIPAGAIRAGSYQIRATVTQGSTSAMSGPCMSLLCSAAA